MCDIPRRSETVARWLRKSRPHACNYLFTICNSMVWTLQHVAASVRGRVVRFWNCSHACFLHARKLRRTRSRHSRAQADAYNKQEIVSSESLLRRPNFVAQTDVRAFRTFICKSFRCTFTTCVSMCRRLFRNERAPFLDKSVWYLTNCFATGGIADVRAFEEANQHIYLQRFTAFFFLLLNFDMCT